MSEPGAKPRWRRFRNYLLLTGLAGLLLLGGLIWYVTTDSFQGVVRRRVVAELQRISGGHADLGGIHTIPFRFQVEIRDLTIHGRESATEIPYAHVDHLVARIKLISILEAEFGFSSLVLDHPVVHIVLYPDGTSNQPTPRSNVASTSTSVEKLFSMSIGQLEVRRGELLWNDQRIPFAFIANDVSADMSYSLLHRRYDGNLLLVKIDTRVDDYRPVAWMAEAHFSLDKVGVEVRSFKANTGRSRLQGSGRLVNFGKPDIVGKYDLTVDLAETAAVTHHAEVRQGVLLAVGEGSWSSTVFSSSGKLWLKNFDWRDPTVGLRGAMLNGANTVNSQR